MKNYLPLILNWFGDKIFIILSIAETYHQKYEMAVLLMIFDQLCRIRQRLEKKR